MSAMRKIELRHAATPTPRRLAHWRRAALFGQASDELRAYIAAGGIDSIVSRFCADAGVSVAKLLGWLSEPPRRSGDWMVILLLIDAVVEAAKAPVQLDDRGMMVPGAVEAKRRTVQALQWLFDTLTPHGLPQTWRTSGQAH